MKKLITILSAIGLGITPSSALSSVVSCGSTNDGILINSISDVNLDDALIQGKTSRYKIAYKNWNKSHDNFDFESWYSKQHTNLENKVDVEGIDPIFYVNPNWLKTEDADSFDNITYKQVQELEQQHPIDNSNEDINTLNNIISGIVYGYWTYNGTIDKSTTNEDYENNLIFHTPERIIQEVSSQDKKTFGEQKDNSIEMILLTLI